MDFPNFNQLLKTSPSSIQEIYVSDLHLENNNKDQPNSLYIAFLEFLDNISVLTNLKKLYILGDWFDVWIGDDCYLTLDENEEKPTHWITQIIERLKKMRIDGCHIFILVGNRDFLMRQTFCNEFIGDLIEEPFYTKIGEDIVRLEHGDALCTDDKAYQRFRKYSRKPFVQWWLLKKNLEKREKIAQSIRKKSRQANSHKATEIMDVNAIAVSEAFSPNDEAIKASKNHLKHSQIIIHGHTHKPDIHTYNDGEHSCIRYVLGDWRIINQNSQNESVSAVIGVTTSTINDIEKINHTDNNEKFDLFEFSCHI